VRSKVQFSGATGLVNASVALKSLTPKPPVKVPVRKWWLQRQCCGTESSENLARGFNDFVECGFYGTMDQVKHVAASSIRRPKAVFLQKKCHYRTFARFFQVSLLISSFSSCNDLSMQLKSRGPPKVKFVKGLHLPSTLARMSYLHGTIFPSLANIQNLCLLTKLI
jgi:hypothetical protein